MKDERVQKVQGFCRGSEVQRFRGAEQVLRFSRGDSAGAEVVQRWCRAGAEVPLLVFRCRDGGALQILRCFAAVRLGGKAVRVPRGMYVEQDSTWN